MYKNNSRIVRVSMLLLVVATFGFAQAPPFVSTNPSQILTALLFVFSAALIAASGV